MTPYDIGEGPDVILSFYNDGRDGKVVDPGFGEHCEDLWRAFIRGYSMVQQWDQFSSVYSKLIDIEGRRPTPYGLKVKNFADWVHSGPGRLRNRAFRLRDPVAILYSQPSLRGNWILEVAWRKDIPETGENWAARDSWSVRQKELSFRVRLSWMMWLHDIGIWPKWVDVSQVDEGYLIRHGYKVLILPRAVALSDRTAEAVRQFVEAGGTVIADSWPGIMDEHCRVRPKGALDDLFGVRRGDYRRIDVRHVPASGKGVRVDQFVLPFLAFEKTLRAEAGRAGGSFEGADVAITRTLKRGRAIYLNFNLEEYFLQRFYPEVVEPARQYLANLLAEAGVRPLFALSLPDDDKPFHPVGHETAIYRSGRGYLVGIMMNPTTRTEELAGVEKRYVAVRNSIFLQEHPAVLKIPAGLFVYDLVEHKALGRVRSVSIISRPWSGRFYACWPFAIQDLVATATVTPDRYLKVTGKIQTSSPVEDEKLVVSMRVYRPDGSEQRAYRRTIDCDGNSFAVELPLAVNEHGDWTVVVEEPCTGKRVSIELRLP